MGCGLAWFYGAIQASVSVLAIVTATFIQVFSNFANDYGDSQKGTDNHHRLGPVRTVQGGKISQREMQAGMAIAGILSFFSGVLLVWLGTWHTSIYAFLIFIALGILSLLAAYFYTAGKKSYGYIGLGDPFVFIFFGLLPVAGVFFLNHGTLPVEIFLPACTIGFFSTGVLNLNNVRDVINDRNSGKITIPVRIGPRKSKLYHVLLIVTAWMAALLFIIGHYHSPWQWLVIVTLPLFAVDLKRIVQVKNERELDPFLKRLALSTLAFTLLFATGLILSL